MLIVIAALESKWDLDLVQYCWGALPLAWLAKINLSRCTMVNKNQIVANGHTLPLLVLFFFIDFSLVACFMSNCFLVFVL